MTPEELEGYRRSKAMAPLSPAAVDELLTACAAMVQDRARIREILAGTLPTFVTAIRSALNELHQIVS